jgi:hypothetical protein
MKVAVVTAAWLRRRRSRADPEIVIRSADVDGVDESNEMVVA